MSSHPVTLQGLHCTTWDKQCCCLLKHYKARPTCLITAFNNTLLSLVEVNAYIMCILITSLTANNMGILIGTKLYLVVAISLWRINFKASSCHPAAKPVFQTTSCSPKAQLSSFLQKTENIMRHFSLDCLVVGGLSCFKPLVEQYLHIKLKKKTLSESWTSKGIVP